MDECLHWLPVPVVEKPETVVTSRHGHTETDVTEVGPARPIEDLGVFGFAQKTAILFIPMGIVASLFGLWLRSEIVTLRSEFKEALAAHALADNRVTRAEFESFRLTIEKQNEEQTKVIQKNTLFLERISQKLGISRPQE